MKQYLGLSVVLLLAGCGGASGASGPATLPPSAPAKTVDASLTITIPTNATQNTQRNPNFVSPSTQSLTVAVNGGAPQEFDVVGSAARCFGTPLTCTVHVAAPIAIAPATDSFAVTLYDAVKAGGNSLGSGTGSGSITVAGGTINVTVDGVVHSVTMVPVTPSITPRVPSSTTLTITAKDADGNVIGGSYASPIMLASNDPSNSLTVTPSTVTSAGQTVTISYSGSTLIFGGNTIGASVANMSVGQSAPLISTKPCAPKFTPKNLYVSWDTGASQNVVNYGPAPYTSNPLAVNSVVNPTFMSIDPNGNLIFSQNNSSGYPANSGNIVYALPSTSFLIPASAASYNVQGSAADDRGDVFLAQSNSGTLVSGFYEIPGPLVTGPPFSTPSVVSTALTSPYSVKIDPYCNLVADGGTAGANYIAFFGTTGQPGGNYGQIPPIINTQVANPAAMAFDSKGNLIYSTSTGLGELTPPYTGAPITLLSTLSGAFIPAIAVDSSDTVIFGNYSSDVVYIATPPYSSATVLTGASGVFSNVIGVAIGP